jgi:hypothetical protein
MLQKDYHKRKTGSRDMYNAEGYKDMTAYLALRNIAREEREARAKQTCRKKRRSAHRPPADRLKAELNENERFAREELANAIIIRAAEDWREAKRMLRSPDIPEEDRRAAEETVRETESFFLSEEYMLLTKLDGRELLSRLKKEERNKNGI